MKLARERIFSRRTPAKVASNLKYGYFLARLEIYGGTLVKL